MSDWETATLDGLIQLETGKREKGGGNTTGEVLSLGGEHISDSGRIVTDKKQKYISREFFERLKKGKIRTGDVLMVKDGATTGKTAWVVEEAGDLAVNEHVFILRSSEPDKLENGFLYFFVCSDSGQSQIRKRFHGLIGGVTRPDILGLKLPLPPLPEQKKIAHILSTVKRAIEAQERIIQTTTELKKALMHKLFTEGLRNEPQKQTEIGPVPESWEVDRFDSFCVLQRGFDITKKQQRPGDYPVVSSGGVSSYHDEAKVKGPGVVIGRKGSLGTVHYITSDYWPHDTTLWVKDFKGHDPRFVSYLLETLKLKRFDTGAANPTLNRNIVHAELIAFPPEDQQKEIGEALRMVEAKISVHQDWRRCFQNLFRTLLHELMTAKTRVHELELTA